MEEGFVPAALQPARPPRLDANAVPEAHREVRRHSSIFAGEAQSASLRSRDLVQAHAALWQGDVYAFGIEALF